MALGYPDFLASMQGRGASIVERNKYWSVRSLSFCKLLELQQHAIYSHKYIVRFECKPTMKPKVQHLIIHGFVECLTLNSKTVWNQFYPALNTINHHHCDPLMYVLCLVCLSYATTTIQIMCCTKKKLLYKGLVWTQHNIMFYTAQLIISISFICKPQRITLQRLDFHPMQTSGTMLVVVRIGAQCRQCRIVLESSQTFGRSPKLYIPSTLNIDLILWHTQLIVCAVKC